MLSATSSQSEMNHFLTLLQYELFAVTILLKIRAGEKTIILPKVRAGEKNIIPPRTKK